MLGMRKVVGPDFVRRISTVRALSEPPRSICERESADGVRYALALLLFPAKDDGVGRLLPDDWAPRAKPQSRPWQFVDVTIPLRATPRTGIARSQLRCRRASDHYIDVLRDTTLPAAAA